MRRGCAFGATAIGGGAALGLGGWALGTIATGGDDDTVVAGPHVAQPFVPSER